jgi:DNA-binding transcriptional regulator YhcF (GntR family)
VKRADFVLPSLVLDSSSEVPFYRQLSKQIARAIEGGELENGSRLPSSRMMARLLRVSRNTVLVAYEELRADGLITAEPCSAVRVAAGEPQMGIYPMRIQSVLRAARFPAKIVSFADQDGNPLYLNF